MWQNERSAIVQPLMSELFCGIVGLPNVGKSTLFRALTRTQAAASNYPFCTVEPNVGVVQLVDPRLDALARLSSSEQILYAVMRFVDIAGLVEGASKGEGLGNQFLANIRETDAIVHVVRCFEDPEVIHVAGEVDPIRDIETINLELILSDLQSCEKILSKVEKQAKGDRTLLPRVTLLKRVLDHLNQDEPVRTLPLTDEEKELLAPYPFLSAKRVLYVANVSEESLPSLENPHVQKVREFAEKEGNEVIAICSKLEAEIAELPVEEQASFLQDLGLEETGLNRLVRACFHLLGLITFLTTGPMETRAWTIKRGTDAREAAGKIHTDIQKGFIRAEVVAYNEMIEAGGRNEAKKRGQLRAEGSGYIVEDGDVILFLHN